MSDPEYTIVFLKSSLSVKFWWDETASCRRYESWHIIVYILNFKILWNVLQRQPIVNFKHKFCFSEK